MIVTFFRGRHTSITRGLEYLMGGTKRRKVAPELLSGNLTVTRELLKQASRFAKAYTYGCLSFEEENIPPSQKQILMESFERTLMTGMTPDQYDIVWIEHRDKGRLELNFHIVNMELSTGKAFTPYVHSRDVKRINIWKCIANDTFSFTDPNDPSKRRTIEIGNNSKLRRDVMKLVDTHMFDMATNGELNSQRDVINALNAIDGITVTRNTKSSISFKAEGYEKPIRLKGDIYGKSFSGVKNLAEQQAERSATFLREREERLKRNKKELRERNRHLGKIRCIQYSKPTAAQPCNTNASKHSDTTLWNGARQVSNDGIRNQYVPKVLPTSKSKGESRANLLQNKITKKQNNQDVKYDTNQPQMPAKWVHETLQSLRVTIARFTERIKKRKSETSRTRSHYETLKRNCIDLDKTLKDREIGVTLTTSLINASQKSINLPQKCLKPSCVELYNKM